MSGTRDIVWIASYPKSGNTWVRFMLCNLLHGRQSSASQLAALIPDVHELPATLLGQVHGLAKTHHVYSPAMPLAHRTAGCLYVIRHPADVLVSNYHYAVRGEAGGESAASFERYVEEFITHRGDPRWIRMGMGGWEEHVRSWLGASHGFPVQCLRYEDIERDPHAACHLLSSWLGAGASDERIAEAIANSRFERMREIEESDIRERRVGIFYKPYLEGSIRDGRRFMRAGVSGAGRETLSIAQRARLRALWSPLLSQLGYPAER